MAKVFYTNGTTTDVEPRNGSDFSLEELQGIVEGYIEPVRIGYDELAIVNEEGLLNGLPRNEAANRYVSEHYNLRTYFVGNVIIIKEAELK